MSGNARPNRLFRNLSSKIASIPMALTALVIFIGCSAWTVVYSFTGSRLLPKTRWVGVDQYDRLWGTDRWIVSIENLAIYGGCMLVFSLTLGFVMAALLDQRIRFENTFRTVFLYPYALSFVVTGLTWQWMLNPTFGLQKVIRDFGFVVKHRMTERCVTRSLEPAVEVVRVVRLPRSQWYTIETAVF